MTITITQYKWTGKIWIFKSKAPCEECDITTSILKSMMAKEFKGKDVKLELKPWNGNIWHCLLRGAYHPPIVFADDKKFHQFSEKKPFFDRKKLAEFVLEKLKNK